MPSSQTFAVVAASRLFAMLAIGGPILWLHQEEGLLSRAALSAVWVYQGVTATRRELQLSLSPTTEAATVGVICALGMTAAPSILAADFGCLAAEIKAVDEAIIISVAAEKGRHRTLSKESVDDLVRAQVSTMPAGLSGFCGDRQGFLDLVRFVIEINRDGPNRLKKLKKRVKVE